MRGLPLLPPVELGLSVATWARVLRDIPVDDLDAAFDKAVEDCPTKEPFGAPHIKAAYVLLLDERAYQRNAAKWRNPGTFACWLCEDEGFQQVLIYCPTRQDWFGSMRPCDCEASHPNMRLPALRPPLWAKGERGIWEPMNHGGLKCGCLACKHAPKERAQPMERS